MRGYQRILVLLFGFQGTINGFVPNRNRDVHFQLSVAKVDKEEELDVLINGVPGSKEDAFNPNDLPEINGYSMPLGQKSSGYSAFLDRSGVSWISNKMKIPSKEELDEDGYVDLKGENRPFVERILRAPFKAVSKLGGRKVREPGTLILVRHGESNWNKNKTFTGWADPDLTEQGKREVEHAARLLMEGGYKIDVVFTSRLSRAIRSCWILLQEFNEVYLPVFKSWRLNERMYGALTGLGKTETAETLGQELVQEWRGSLRSRPPALKVGDKYWPGRDRKYADLTKDQIPLTESLLDCMERTYPLWEDKIKYELQQGRNVMVVAQQTQIGDAEIQDVAIPTGIPIIYKFDKNLNSLPPPKDAGAVSQVHMNGLFLEKPGLLKEALKREDEWAKAVPGYDSTMSRHKTPMTSLERSLYKLNATRELGEWAREFIDLDAPVEDDGNDGNFGKPMMISEDAVWEQGMKELEVGGQFDPDAPVFHADKKSIEKEDQEWKPDDNILYNQPCVTSMPSAEVLRNGQSTPIRRDSVIVIIRHGKTQHNKLGLFTGWEDAPLADEGVEEAKEAGRLLRKHGFEFDVVYTSWLSRALATAWHVMDEMDALWLPIIKTWRLNERMYGELTGLSKKMVKQRHGDAQFKAWRRGYDVKPPPVSSFSPHYPGNDLRYQKFLRDRRVSIRESMIRSIERGEPVLMRKLPKSESLKDCMDRTIPYFVERIMPDAVEQGKRVLISSSENAIRGLLMHLCEIPEDQITGLEIPNGLPLIFDVKSKCVKLLDDGSGRDPLQVYNFGTAAKYLFRPCQNEDGTPDEECTITFESGSTPLSAADRETIDFITKRTPKPESQATEPVRNEVEA
eukprot:CAMPEP_0117081632 /NCGR_PEP_ID=MMETSP0472-20121206/57510_1 /TAXON_ID=693140 ORGANISM="Tiarina fusus, Strain LIS" /NCGR_SAMPLE_ID=MMETSP0472 /ASSEMBLY_ACC=CAM_ASM_000603 /LENGTH=851 /DNA_ID=CAMNT_0004809591 /DNA_START=87 /DNA_END=2643 /DNA_ORIENTATION=+